MNEIAVIDPLVDRLRTLLGLPPYSGEALPTRTDANDPTVTEGSESPSDGEAALDPEPLPERSALEQVMDRLAHGASRSSPSKRRWTWRCRGSAGGARC